MKKSKLTLDDIKAVAWSTDDPHAKEALTVAVAALIWMRDNWSADAPDDGDRSNIPENIRDLIP